VRKTASSDFSSAFSESGFWKKIVQVLARGCRELSEKALTLFFCLIDKDTPVWAKAKITAALGYLIWPIDAVPDALPVVGYTDDLGVIVLAVKTVYDSIKPEHTAKAKRVMRKLMGRGR